MSLLTGQQWRKRRMCRGLVSPLTHTLQSITQWSWAKAQQGCREVICCWWKPAANYCLLWQKEGIVTPWAAILYGPGMLLTINCILGTRSSPYFSEWSLSLKKWGMLHIHEADTATREILPSFESLVCVAAAAICLGLSQLPGFQQGDCQEASISCNT